MQRRPRSSRDGDDAPNLVPILNVMLLLIPALLLAMEVASFAAITVTPPRFVPSPMASTPKEPVPESLDFTVAIRDDGFRVEAVGQRLTGASPSGPPDIPRLPGEPTLEADLYDYAMLEAKARARASRGRRPSPPT